VTTGRLQPLSEHLPTLLIVYLCPAHDYGWDRVLASSIIDACGNAGGVGRGGGVLILDLTCYAL
jgi:hypothetical protein